MGVYGFRSYVVSLHHPRSEMAVTSEAITFMSEVRERGGKLSGNKNGSLISMMLWLFVVFLPLNTETVKIVLKYWYQSRKPTENLNRGKKNKPRSKSLTFTEQITSQSEAASLVVTCLEQSSIMSYWQHRKDIVKLKKYHFQLNQYLKNINFEKIYLIILRLSVSRKCSTSPEYHL